MKQTRLPVEVYIISNHSMEEGSVCPINDWHFKMLAAELFM